MTLGVTNCANSEQRVIEIVFCLKKFLQNVYGYRIASAAKLLHPILGKEIFCSAFSLKCVILEYVCESACVDVFAFISSKLSMNNT